MKKALLSVAVLSCLISANTVADGLTKTYALDVVDSIVSESGKNVFSASLPIKGAEPSTASALSVLAYPNGCESPSGVVTAGEVKVGATIVAHDLQSGDVPTWPHTFRIAYQVTELVRMEAVNVDKCVYQKPKTVELKIEKDLKLSHNNPVLLGYYEDSKGLAHEVMVTAK